jgi:hypothetical protein
MSITFILPKLINENYVDNTNKDTKGINKNIKSTLATLRNLEKATQKLNQALYKIIDILKINGSVHVLIKDEYLNSKEIITMLKQFCENENIKGFDYFKNNDKSFIAEIEVHQEKAIA